jgi:uronate dehydrogenase
MAVLLVTGATGEVARGVLPILAQHFTLRLLAPDAPEDDPRFVRTNVLDWFALAEVMQGVNVVLHLAVAPGHSGTYEDDSFNDQRFDVNVKGTYHVFETARRAGVRRVVHVSSVMVTWGHALKLLAEQSAEKVPGDAPPHPVGTYALTKALSEEIARSYGEHQGLEVITLRITAPLDVSAPNLRSKPVRPQQIPFPDLAQALVKALTVPLAGYRVVTIAGSSALCLWSLEAARQVLGYEPQITLDEMGLEYAPPFHVNKQ